MDIIMGGRKGSFYQSDLFRKKTIDIMEKITTMGGRSAFQFKLNDRNELYIQFGRMIKPIKIKGEIIEQVRKRVNVNSEAIKGASYYNQKRWLECKDNRASPYIAQLILLGKI